MLANMLSPAESSQADQNEEGARAGLVQPVAPDPHDEIAAETPRLWTAWLDYYATGEGRAFMACIAYAKSEDEIRSHFGRKFHPWYAQGCDVGQGVVRDDLTLFVWSGAMLDAIETCAGKGAAVEAHCWMHFNLS